MCLSTLLFFDGFPNCLIQYTFNVYYTYFVFESHIFLICYVINKTTNGTLGKWTRLRGVWLMEWFMAIWIFIKLGLAQTRSKINQLIGGSRGMKSYCLENIVGLDFCKYCVTDRTKWLQAGHHNTGMGKLSVFSGTIGNRGPRWGHWNDHCHQRHRMTLVKEVRHNVTSVSCAGMSTSDPPPCPSPVLIALLSLSTL